MVVVEIGYFLGWNKAKDFWIETGRDDISLTIEEVTEFDKIHDYSKEKITSEEMQQLEKYRNMGLVEFASTHYELYDKIKGLHPIRQGIRVAQEEELFILFGAEKAASFESFPLAYPITGMQAIIWRYSDGKRTISEIGDILYFAGHQLLPDGSLPPNRLNIREFLEDYMKSLIILQEFALISLRF